MLKKLPYGSVILQQQGETWRPVAYASRSMTDAEHRYAQIEEALVITWACQILKLRPGKQVSHRIQP